MQLAPALRNLLVAPISSGRFRAYLQILLVGSSARLFGLASQFLVLLILSRVLSKGSFGDLMTAFGFYRLVGMALGIAGSLVLLFHISRRPEDRDAEIRLHRYSALLGALTSAAVAVGGFLAAEPIAHALEKPELAVWFRALAPFAIF